MQSGPSDESARRDDAGGDFLDYTSVVLENVSGPCAFLPRASHVVRSSHPNAADSDRGPRFGRDRAEVVAQDGEIGAPASLETAEADGPTCRSVGRLRVGA